MAGPQDQPATVIHFRRLRVWKDSTSYVSGLLDACSRAIPDSDFWIPNSAVLAVRLFQLDNPPMRSIYWRRSPGIRPESLSPHVVEGETGP